MLLTLCRPRLMPLMLGLLLTFLPFASFAAMPAADEQAIQGVVLNDAVLDKLIAVKVEGRALGIEENETVAESLTSLDAMTRAITQDPRIESVLAKHRISARDYAASSIALMRAMFAAQLGGSPAASGTTSANIDFAKSRMGKIQSLFSNEDTVNDDGEE